MRDQVRNIHMVGIGGSGMSGIAEVLHNLQFNVTGSDVADNANTRRLKKLGISISFGHKKENIGGANIVVVSSAIDTANPEVAAAKAKKIPVIPRAQMLGELMRLQHGIAVAGTHGKTTTTSFIASLLEAGGMDPTFVVGGRINSFDTSARLGKGRYLVAEADESDASFLHLQPQIAVVTNIDADHMETYGGDMDRLKETFISFLHNLPFYGLAVLCYDDLIVREIIPHIQRPVTTYGTHKAADVCAYDIRCIDMHMHFKVRWKGEKEELNVTLNQIGRHNVLNALAAIIIAREAGVSDADIVAGLKGFAGIDRRLQILGELNVDGGQAILMDDYGHHPREIHATVQAAHEAWPGRRIVVVFQPHRYTRTRDLFDDFCTVLADFDPLIIVEVYPAGEKEIPYANGRALCRAIRSRGKVDPIFIENLQTLQATLRKVVQPNDVVMTLGAGNISQASRDLFASWGRAA